MTGTKNVLSVEVIYAEPARVDRTALTLAPGTTLRAAVERSGVLGRCPDIDLGEAVFGVFGRVRALDEALSDGDRVEIYRPLKADPKQARRQRVRIARRKVC